MVSRCGTQFFSFLWTLMIAASIPRTLSHAHVSKKNQQYIEASPSEFLTFKDIIERREYSYTLLDCMNNFFLVCKLE